MGTSPQLLSKSCEYLESVDPTPRIPPTALETVRLDEALAQLRALEEQVRGAEGNLCILRITEGAVLIPIQKSVGHGRWLSFLRECGLAARNAQIAMQLAEHRTEIEAANAKRASHLSVREALKLIRPENLTPKSASPNTATEDPYSPAVLKKLHAVDRARILAALGIMRVDVPSDVAADIARHAIAQVDFLDASAKQQTPTWRVLESMRTTLATNMPAVHLVATLRDIIEDFDDQTKRTKYVRDRLAPESHYPMREAKPETKSKH